ncbi:alpha/beta hydrolase family esterase [Fulvivirga sedimenti]|uniref:alpha/beta hydrolase family esterase n=1 Tax=Fulvivirga sedimenti TaxID=2879465 RepID=UPI001CE24213|nr:PHB depolymerase family esterase [Fulvivirga sedimenti]
MGLVIILSGCAKEHFEGTEQRRSYRIHLPSGYADNGEELPVLIVLHGNPSNGWQMMLWTGMNKTADEYGFVVVYPDATNKKWPIIPENNVTEISDMKRLVDEITRRYRVDSDRFFLAGISGGGIFSFQVMKELPGLFAGFAVVSGNLPRSYDNEDFQSAPFLYIHGTADYLYPGRVELLSADDTLMKWLSVNNCDPTPMITELPDTNERDESTVSRLTYNGDPGNGVIFYRVNGGGHQWPGAVFNANTFHGNPLGPLNKDLSANEAIWRFMERNFPATANN